MEPDNLKILGRLGPFSALSETDLKLIAERGTFTDHPVGTLLFKRSANDDHSHFLLKGKLNLVDSAFDNQPFTDADSVNYGAVDDFEPHRVSAVCESPCLVFSFPKTVRDSIEGLLENAAASAEGVEVETNWMERLLKTPLFEFIPTANIQALFKCFEPYQMLAGDVVVKQGDPGDYFYVIKRGILRCEVEKDGTFSEVAKLSIGQSFGQDALISDLPRNASVTAETSGELMRLSEEDFERLLLAPVIEVIQPSAIEPLSQSLDSEVMIIDVRPSVDSESEDSSMLHIPFLSLRTHLEELSTEKVYVIKGSGPEKIAELSAYLLNESGFTAYVLAP